MEFVESHSVDLVHAWENSPHVTRWRETERLLVETSSCIVKSARKICIFISSFKLPISIQ